MAKQTTKTVVKKGTVAATTKRGAKDTADKVGILQTQLDEIQEEIPALVEKLAEKDKTIEGLREHIDNLYKKEASLQKKEGPDTTFGELINGLINVYHDTVTNVRVVENFIERSTGKTNLMMAPELRHQNSALAYLLHVMESFKALNAKFDSAIAALETIG